MGNRFIYKFVYISSVTVSTINIQALSIFDRLQDGYR